MNSTLLKLAQSLGFKKDIDNLKSNTTEGVDSVSEVYDLLLTNIDRINLLESSLSGASGSNGSSGTSGVDGLSGASGSNGSSGTSGVDGLSGVNGSAGSSGTSGVDGLPGTSGANGSSGTSGVNGSAGSSGTSGANKKVAFSPMNISSCDTAPTAGTTQFYYLTIAEMDMTISKAKLWGYSGTDTVLFGIYRGTFESHTLIGEGSAVCGLGPNVIDIIPKAGQTLDVTTGENLIVGFYPAGTSWRTIYDNGINDLMFGITNTNNINSMPATILGTATAVRFALTLY
jgi:hypothetical protein